MDNTDFFINPLQTYNFLSIINAIDILSNIFNDQKLLAQEDLFQPIPVVNTLCEYLNKNNNSENATIALSKQLLKNSDMYGSKENETIHFKYAEAMLNHIIETSVFLKYGNIIGYLSAIVNATNNLTLTFVKEAIVTNLRKQTFLNLNFTSTTLTSVSVKQITEKLIFPLFPTLEDENEMKIIDVDYIYAQAGLIFAKSAQIDSQNISFEEYIIYAQSIDQGVRIGELNETALQIFQIPAILYFTHKRPQLFINISFDAITTNTSFWNESYSLLFSYLHAEQQKVNDVLKSSVTKQFETALFNYKNRTEYAEYILRRMCPLENEDNYKTEVVEYKYNHANYYCKTDNFKMPDINELFSQQNEYIANVYSNLEAELIKNAVTKDFIQFINQRNVTAWPLTLIRNRICGLQCLNFKEELRDDTFIFRIKVNGTDYSDCALVRGRKKVTFYSSKTDRELLMRKIGILNSTQFTIPPNKKPLKDSYQKFIELVKNLLEPKRRSFYNLLQSQGYDPTTGEKVIKFLKNFIPFYSCYQAIRNENLMKTILVCLVDSLILIPAFGLIASIGLKIGKAITVPLVMSLKTSIKATAIGQFVKLSLIKTSAVQTANQLSKEISKDLLKKIGKTTLRTLDPGFELSYVLGKVGLTSVTKFFSIIGRKMSSLSNALETLNIVKYPSISKVTTFKGNDVYVNSISGNDGYGIKYFTYKESTVELRKMRGYKNEMPVVLVSDPEKQKRIYQIMDMEKGELEATRWELKNDVLVVEVKPLAARLKTIQVEGLSGRGKIINLRGENYFNTIAKREDGVEILKKIMDESSARNVMSHYIFEGNERTHAMLANEWVLSNFCPEWSQKYRINNVKLHDSLRYDVFIESNDFTEDVAIQSLKNYCGEKFVNEISTVDIKQVFQYYTENFGNCLIPFVDYYSFVNLISGRFIYSSLDVPEAWHMRKSVYKMALRLADNPITEQTRTLYKVEVKSSEALSGIVAGKNLDIAQFTMFESIVSSSSDNILIKSLDDASSQAKVLFEIKVNDPFVIIDIETLFPSLEKNVLLLPGIRFVIESAEPALVDGIQITLVKLNSVKVSKSKWVAHFTNIIDKLMIKEANYRSNAISL